MVLKKIIKYNTQRWNFRDVIERFLQSKRLEFLHETVDYDVFSRESDQSSIFHKKFYQTCDINNEFDLLYQKWIKEFVSPFIGDNKLVYQVRPSFRVHLSDNVAYGS